MLMLRGSGESDQNTVVKTKALNDTAVEYIGGIEVIKAFGKAKTSYEKFVIAAQEGADCFIEWMRRCNVYQNAALVLMPATLLPLLPFGISFYMTGTVTASDFLMLIILSLGLITPFVVAASYMDDIQRLCKPDKKTGGLSWKDDAEWNEFGPCKDGGLGAVSPTGNGSG